MPLPKTVAVRRPELPEDELLAMAAADDAALEATGFVRDERGLRFVGEVAD